ncbi:putative bifunctional diguanylate cyclase/phosphodiesterase [Pseudomonas schmalbachii]|uniref:EAL domain-containing protein n=1 Tax=Pseudomonas schmalbachii TaxID=2816993 RepID=A0ABS3TT70_9PSED|nr:GGDEF domain-containing phosphodiesterase [Pseudomonas schmalbachii]MBO3276865.1 EAL domain-containing protein [Pseudomonas schmalbachii]
MSNLLNARRLSSLYVLCASLWILLSDLWLGRSENTTWQVVQAEMYKGMVFVGLTGLLLYLVLRLHERQQSRQHRALLKGQERLSQAAIVFESTQEGVLVTDPLLRITYINPAVSRITGYTEAEMFGQTPRLLQSGRHDAQFYRSMWCSLAEQQHWSGEIWNRRKDGTLYAQWQCIRAIHDRQGEVSHYVAVFSDLSAIKRSESELLHQSLHDALSGLPNRLLFIDRITHALARSRTDQVSGAVMLLDLDHFQHINDSLGHSVGDQLLQQVAQRLRNTFAENITVARMGGDEFALLCEHCPKAEQAIAIAEQIRKLMAAPFHINGHDYSMSTSIGITLYPGDARTAENLLSNADSALFNAKSKGRATYAFYSQELTERSSRLLELARSLRQSLANNEFRVHYQPIHDMQDGQLVGAEALVRWQHPKRGLVPPGEFIPLAEQSGMIASIDLWVLEQACNQLQAWPGLRYISTNISSRLFCEDDFDIRVARILGRTAVDPRRVELEITESTVMHDPVAAQDMMVRLRALGVQLSIDDFGTGQSSLTRLKHFPVHKLKLDQSFVRGLPHDSADMAIARSIITLGHSMGITVLAEGIEQAAHRDTLRALGCDLGQGYFLGRPQPPEKWTEAPVDMAPRRLSACSGTK